MDYEEFLRRHLVSFDRMEILAGYASSRRYYRVFRPGGTVILCDDPEFRESPEGEYPFLLVHRLFSGAGIPVPSVIAADRERGFLLLEDLGDALMDSVVPALDGDALKALYRKVLGELAAIQSLTGEGKVPFGLRFDAEKLMYEFDFFIQYGLTGYFGVVLSDRDARALRSEFVKIATLLDRPDLFVLNHRDFHSRNILVRGNVPWVVDFQHARMGLPQYDLASLLRDDYVRLDPAFADSLLRDYFRLSGDRGIHRMSGDEFIRLFDIMAFQRSVKAIGSFGYQITQRGNEFYRRYVPSTMAYLPGAAGRREELAVPFALLGPMFEAVS